MAVEPKVRPDVVILRALYLEHGLSTTAIGELFGVSASTAARWLRAAEIRGDTRRRSGRDHQDMKAGEPIGRACTACGTWKPASEFYIDKRYGTLLSRCKRCVLNAQRADYQARYPTDDAYRQRFSDSAKRRKQRIRDAVLSAYGGACACCGESERKFLTLDHVDGDGAHHRRAVGVMTGIETWAWAMDNGFPNSLQLLCWNCNSAKGAYGTCPHRRRRT